MKLWKKIRQIPTVKKFFENCDVLISRNFLGKILFQKKLWENLSNRISQKFCLKIWCFVLTNFFGKKSHFKKIVKKFVKSHQSNNFDENYDISNWRIFYEKESYILHRVFDDLGNLNMLLRKYIPKGIFMSVKSMLSSFVKMVIFIWDLSWDKQHVTPRTVVH